MGLPEDLVVASTDVSFRILGPIEVSTPAGPVPVPPGRQQVILGALLLDANRVVHVDRLIDAVWDERPPGTARSQVQICVSSLRQILAGVGLGGAIVTRAPGYVLKVADAQVDVRRFRSLVVQAGAAVAGDRLPEAAELYRQALALWHGPAFGGDVGAALRGRVTRLDEERLDAIENHLDVELRLGRHTRLVAELSGLSAEHPLRERLRGQLMLALYRSGRSAEALEVYRAGRRTTIEELGIEPGEELRRLEAAILAEDRTLNLGDAARPSMAGAHQLPADIADFTGRESLIDEVESVLGDADGEAVHVVLLAGKAGVGKTTLAVRVAHRLRRDRFPDGQLYCSLNGTRPDPVEPSDVLARFLRALGVPGAGIPEHQEERAEVYRSLLANRRVLVVLDDAGSERQVVPLLPGSESCAVVVTSRARLTGIPGARLFGVDVLDADNALKLLGRVIGLDRVAREPAAARALVRLVGGLSLALRIVAARLAARPHWTLVSMVGRLTDERRRLDELAHGDMVVRASLSLTHDGLDAEASRLFRLLDLAPGENQPDWVGAAVLDVDVPHAEGLLEQLVDTQMLDVVALDARSRPRYAFHDVIRLFAQERWRRDEEPAAVAAARGRVLGGWLALVQDAHRLLYGGDYTVLRGTAARWCPPGGFDEDLLSDPLERLDAERFSLCAAVGAAADAGLDELSWELATGLVTLFEANSYFDQWLRTHELALTAVRAAGNRRGEAALLCSLGSLHLSRTLYGASRAVLRPALVAFEELGDAHGLALTWRNLATLDYNEGAHAAAAEGFERALAGFREVGDLIGQAHVLSQVAQIRLDAGEHTTAVDHLNVALAMCREAGGSRVEAQVLFRLGTAMVLQGRHAQAESTLDAVLGMVRDNRDILGEGHALHALGVLRGRLGKVEEGERLLRASVQVRERVLDQVGAARAHLDLARLVAGTGRVAEAIDLVDWALRVFVERGIQAGERRARAVLDGLVQGIPVDGL